MRPSRDDLQDYEKRVTDNYQTLINVLLLSQNNLGTLLNEKDPPNQANPSFIESALDIALTVVAPQVWGFVKAKRLSEAAKALAEDAGMVLDGLKTVPTLKDKVAGLIAAKDAPETPSATLKMMDCITAMYKRLERQKALASANFDALKALLPQKGAKVDAIFAKTDWKQPPEPLGNAVDDLVYVFMYTLVREAIQRYVEIHVWVNKTWGPYTTSNIVLEVKPITLSQRSMDWIFANFNRGLSGKELPGSANVPGGPATNRIVPVTNYVQLATAWQPRVEIEATDIGMVGDRDRYRAFLKGERLPSIFIHLYWTGHGYVPRLNKFGAVEGYDDPVTAQIRKMTGAARR